MTLVVVDAVGLTPRALKHMPRVSKLGADGFSAALDPIVPAVTCSVQASFVTGVVWVVDGGVGISRGTPGTRGDIAAPPVTLPVAHSLEGFAHDGDGKPGEGG